jgi:nicotinamidase/pyrazinamidase
MTPLMTRLDENDALILVDVQVDLCPGGRLPVPDGDRVVAVRNRWIEAALRGKSVIVTSRDWHPANHASFREQGGPWPAHCFQNTPGANRED